MANIDNPKGLQVVKHRFGVPLNAAVNPYYVPASYGTALFIGDPVVKTGTANTAIEAAGAEAFPIGYLPEINAASAAGVITGVMVGRRNIVGDFQNLHNPLSTEGIILVCDDPYVVFRVQEDSVGGSVAVASVGLNAEVALTAGDTVTGISKCELDSNTVNTTAGLALKILRIDPDHGNAVGNNADWQVIINDHTEISGADGI